MLSTTKHLVFVYGTLKLGFGNNVLLQDATYVGKAETMDLHKMADGGFPVVYDLENRLDPTLEELEDNRVGVIVGEVYEVNDEILERLDQLEGHPDWYHRYEREVCLDDDHDVANVLTAWIYIGDNVIRPEEFLMEIENGLCLEWKGYS